MFVCVCVCARMCQERLCVCLAAVSALPSPGGDRRCLLPRMRGRAGTCALCIWCHRSVRARVATGVTWTSRTLAAPWGPRYDHTAVIDFSGAIYVIGGIGDALVDGAYYRKDVWVSTDGGADPDFGGWSEVLSSHGCPSGYARVYHVLGTRRVLKGCRGVL